MNFNFKKKYGQNFLQDKSIIRKIVSSINPTEDDLIIEIGPGAGALTHLLVSSNANILCYEIDLDVDKFLSPLKSSKMQIIYDDFLKRDILKDIKDITYRNLYVIGNLPYYITTPIIMHIIESNIVVSEMVFMVQNEVADRFSARPGSREYGSISVFLNYYYTIDKLFVVDKKKFYPVPKVDSAVIKLQKKNDISSVDIKKFNKLVRDAFQFKRKNLRNNLKGYDLERINAILLEFGFSISNRAEELDYQVFVELANKY